MFSKVTLFVLATALAILMSNSVSIYANNSRMDEIIKAAKDGKNVLFKDHRKQKLSNFGFLNQEEVDDAVIEEGFNVWTISPDEIVNYSNQEYLSLVIPTNVWQFIVKTKEKDVVLITVDYVDGKWLAVSMGYADLAKELRKILLRWPSSNGYEYKIIRIYQAASDFIELSKDGSLVGIIPLTYGRKALGVAGQYNDHMELHDIKHVIDKVKPIVIRNIYR